MDVIANFERLLASGKDNALLRFGLGNAYFRQGEFAKAVEHLAMAVKYDAGYSAAWKIYGKALVEAGRPADARQAYANGILNAERKGDVQAAKEMKVFLRRLEKNTS